MVNAIFFGINILLFIFLWKKMIRPSMLDHYRDKLFDLREEVREFYVAKKIPLNDKTYIRLRNLINAHLRFTEELSLIKLYSFMVQINKDDEMKVLFQKEIDKIFSTSNSMLSEYIASVRERSVYILTEYMVFSSPGLVVFFTLTAIVSLPVFIGKIVFCKIKTELNYIGDVMSIVARIISPQNYLEELSYKTGMPGNTKAAHQYV